MVNDVASQDVKFVIMKDDGRGMSVNIPSLLINKNDGEIIKEYLDLHKDEFENGYGLFPILKISFDLPRPDDRVEYDVWFSAASPEGINFLTKLRKYNDKLGEKVLMTPHYLTWNCGD